VLRSRTVQPASKSLAVGVRPSALNALAPKALAVVASKLRSAMNGAMPLMLTAS
jgi:hypothetical protein